MNIHADFKLKNRWIMMLSIILFSFATSNLYADIVIIVHPENDSALTPGDLKQIFLQKTKKFPNGEKVLPINQKFSSDIRQTIIKKLLRKLPRQDKAYWANYQFSGKGSPPRVVKGDEDVISLVSTNKYSIGYIDKASLNDSVKAVYTISTD